VIDVLRGAPVEGVSHCFTFARRADGYRNEHDEAVPDTIPVEEGDEEWVW
jgi:hypothetical protein